MTRALRRIPALVLALLPVSSSVSADDAPPCLVAVESFSTCWRRLTQQPGIPEPPAAPTDADKEGAAKQVKKDLKAKTTGNDALEGLASTTSDFLSPFAAALGVAPTTTESGDVAFEKSF